MKKKRKNSQKNISSLLTCCTAFIATNCWAAFKRWFRKTDWRTKRIINTKRHFISEMWYRCLTRSYTLCLSSPGTDTHSMWMQDRQDEFSMYPCVYVCMCFTTKEKMWFERQKLGLGNCAKEIKQAKVSNGKEHHIACNVRKLRAFRYEMAKKLNREHNEQERKQKKEINYMQFKRKFSIQPNNQRAAILLHGNSVFGELYLFLFPVTFFRSLARPVHVWL